MDYFFSKIFINALNDRFKNGNSNIVVPKENLEELENALQDFIHRVIGFRFDNKYDFGMVRIYFDNICRHLDLNRGLSLIDAIKKYQEEYLNLIDNHYYVKLFVDVAKRIYSDNYDGKLIINEHGLPSKKSNASIAHYDNFLIISKRNRQGDLLMPAIKINNFERFEEILEEYIESIKSTDTFYNVFNNPNFASFSEEEKIKIIFEGTLLNAGNYEFASIEKFFDKYTNFVIDDSFNDMRAVTKIGEAFNDELYFAVKRSSIEYETPYFFSFMLRNHRLELPNARVAVTQTQKGKKAYIVATQSSQITPNNHEISEIIKENIPRTSKFRVFNPDHLVANLLTFGILNGMGIKDIEVSDYMPLRCYKTVKDKDMNESEAENYVKRVVDKNIYTYFKLCEVCEGIAVTSLPDGGSVLNIHLDDNISCSSELLNNLYNIAYEYGKSKKIDILSK